MMAVFAWQSSPPNLVRAQSNASVTEAKSIKAKQQPMLRRHSSGDHAVFAGAGREAMRKSQKNFGVPHDLVQDGSGNNLPTTRGY